MSQSPTKAKLSPLHCHSVFSVLDGASNIDDYLKWCKDNGAPGLALTDHGLVIGAKELVEKANKAGITPLPGCEFYLAPDKDYEFKGKAYDYYHVTVWSINEKGYRNLLKLASLAWGQDSLQVQHSVMEKNPETKKMKWSGVNEIREKPRVATKWGTQQKPRITFDELLTYNEGLVLGSGCLIGSLSKALIEGENKGAERNLNKLLEVYKGRMFMELMPHHCTHNYNHDLKKFEQNECTDFAPGGDLQKSVNEGIVDLAKKYKLPLLLTIDSHFTTPDKKKIQDILLSNGDANGFTFFNSYHMMTTEEAWENWKSLHGDDVEQKKIFTEAVENNDVLVNMAKGMNVKDEYRQPSPEIPTIILNSAKNHDEALKALLIQKIAEHGRIDFKNPVYVERLMYELSVICDNGVANFGNYFGSLEDWCKWAIDHSILSAPGRGSAAGCLVAYGLKITHLDPIKFNLPFSRFLSNPRINRGKFPDVDWDMGNRDLLVAYLRERYGSKMAQVSTLHTLKIKSAIKDACRTMLGWNSNDPRVDAVTRPLPMAEPQGVASKDVLIGYTDSDGNQHEGWIFQYPLLDQFFKDHKDVYDCVLQLLGIPRAISRHASAFIISDRDISDNSPTCNISGYLCTQYNANAAFNSVEKAGLVKYDFLRVNTLDDISNCVRLVQQKFGYKVWEEELVFSGETFKITKGDLRIDQLPIDDKGTVLDIYQLPDDLEVYRQLSAGNTETVFQMNSALMTSQTMQIQPNALMDLSDIVALVRPGPLTADTGVPIAQVDKLNVNVAKTWPDGSIKTTYSMTELYIAARHDRVPVSFAHPDMEPIVKDTFGVFVYQEQLQQAFSDLAGYSPEEADAMREMLAKKKKAEVEKAIPELRRRLREKKWTDKQIDVFVSLCIASSAYSFNRAHSASYGVVAYMSAYLKTKFPLEWWCSVLKGASRDDIREKGYAVTLLEQGILQLPHVNGPTDTFILEDGKVHAPLYLIDGIGPSTCLAIKAAGKKGKFTSFQDFFERVDGSKVDLGNYHNLILCGCFSTIEPNKTMKELLSDYHYFRKVRTLKTYGFGKSGKDLENAVSKYKADGHSISVPELFTDGVQFEIMKLKALPIYELDVHKRFQESLKAKTFKYHSNGFIEYSDQNTQYQVFRNIAEIDHAISVNNRPVSGMFIGVLQDHSEFSFTDKKSGQKVTALKIKINNAGSTLEAVIWPSIYQQIPDVVDKISKIMFAVKGVIKPAFIPGEYSMSVENIYYL